MNLSLRTRITANFVVAIVALGVIITIAGTHFIGSGIINQAQTKVRLDLNTAREVYRNKQESIKTILSFTAIRPSIKKALIERDTTLLRSSLDEVRLEGDIDILTVADPDGVVILRSHNPSVLGDKQAENPLIEKALRDRVPVASTELVPAAELRKEGSEFAERARIEVVPTPKAGPGPAAVEEDGMLLAAAVPIFGEKGELIGVIYGGKLLNRDIDIVDKIRDIVYRDERYEGKNVGTVTIFQGDTRISTNVPTKDNERAIGTRVSKAVNDRVLKEGRSWIDEAFVVNDWYITAYEPIYNLGNQIIGILYVGMLKKPFVAVRTRVVAVFLGIVIFGAAIVILVAHFLAAGILKPLKEMQVNAHLIADGDYTRNIEVKSSDELGELASSFNKMTKKLLKVQDELREWGSNLEDKVEERTSKIREMQRQLIQAEKLASVGKLAAGVAHEINNPLTGILTNSSLLLEDLKEGSPQYEEIKSIVDETIRCREIVKGLLDFARQTAPQKTPTDVNKLIDSVIDLVERQVIFQNIRVKKVLADALPQILLDKDQMKQVFMNIVLNAAEAMPEGGELNIASDLNRDGKMVCIKFTDTGCGIDEEHAARLFDPFFSTKEKGTGLGLAISYGIVERHGGTIEVMSKKGDGSTFVVKLPIAQKDKQEIIE